MAGLEYIVRPAVFPGIRPTPGPSTLKDDPDKGKATITGSSGKTIDLPYSYSMTTSESRRRERKRRYDRARVYQKDDDGNINRDNFIDINVANKIWFKEGQIDSTVWYKPIKETDNIEIIKKNEIEETK